MADFVQPIHRMQKRIRQRVPDPALGYLIALVAVAALTVPILAFYHLPEPRNVLLSGALSVTILVVLFGCAWRGYGPGLTACILLVFGISRLLPPSPRAANRPVQFGILATLCVLVSRVAQVGRARRQDLQRAAAELEQRVRERTAEAVQAANAARERAELLEMARDAIVTQDWDGTICYWSAGAARMYGWSKDEALGRNAHRLLQTRFPMQVDDIRARIAEIGHWEGELQHTSRSGAVLHVLSRWALRKDSHGEPAGFLEINTDITERRQIEEQLRQTQKLESLGVLAGGVAHDFNNLLTGILGNASLALDALPPDHPDRHSLDEVVRAAERAADLTRQLLAYTGKGRFILRAVDLSALVRDIGGLVQASIPKAVQLRFELAPDLPTIEADPGQLQQIVMNLVINGAEAIDENGGSVLVRTSAQTVDEAYARALGMDSDQLRPGLYVSLEAHDTGCGMSPDTMARIFDPFFTTKFTGRGLGLSAVQGIVRAHRGALNVYSTPGQGTTFKVLLPATGRTAETHPAVAAVDLDGHGAVLVVDDEDLVRETARQSLARYGYQPILAPNGAEAVEIFRRDPDRIALVLLDLTMPVMSGEQTLRELRRIRSSVRVLLSSGYHEDEALKRFAAVGFVGFIQKPYSAASLAGKVKAALSP